MVSSDGYVAHDKNGSKYIWFNMEYFDYYFISIKKARKLKLEKLNNYENRG